MPSAPPTASADRISKSASTGIETGRDSPSRRSPGQAPIASFATPPRTPIIAARMKRFGGINEE